MIFLKLDFMDLLDSVDFLDINLKVPHMGWNDLKFEKKDDLILKYIK